MAAAAAAGAPPAPGDDATEPEYLSVSKLRVEPAAAAVTSPLTLEATVVLAQPVRTAHWTVTWIADSTRRRYVTVLGRTPQTDYAAAGPVSFKFESGPIDVSHLKPSQLSNVGLLVATLTGVLGTAPAGSEARELGAINLVVQVVPGDGGVFNRCILNPWEE